MRDTWATRELPVLDATVSLLDESYMVTVSDIVARTGLEAPAVARALETLDPVYVDFRKTTTGGDPTFWYVLKVTPEARRAVGQWPTPDSFVTQLAAELSAAAAAEQDAERKGLLSYAARLVGDSLRDVVVRAAGRVLAPATDRPAPPAPAPVPPAPLRAAPAPVTPAPVAPAPVAPAPLASAPVAAVPAAPAQPVAPAQPAAQGPVRAEPAAMPAFLVPPVPATPAADRRASLAPAPEPEQAQA